MSVEAEVRENLQSPLGVLGTIGAMVVLTMLGFLGALFMAWAFTVNWDWFVQPTYGWEPPPLIALAGMMLMFRSLIIHMAVNQDDDKPLKERIIQSVATTIAAPLVFIFMGWILHLFL